MSTKTLSAETFPGTAQFETSTKTSTTEKPRGAFARYMPNAARVLLGLTFFVFGLSGFIDFMPPPPDTMPEGALAFGTALMKTGYMFPLIKGTEVLVGVLLLLNRFVPLALVILAPVLVNIAAFNLILARSGAGLVAVLVALQLYLAWVHRAAYRPLLAPRAVAA